MTAPHPPHDPSARSRADAGRADRPFPPAITYRALEGQPRAIQVVLATAVLPLEVTVSGVRTLHAVEQVLVELVAHLRALRPAVAAASDAYATGRFDPMFRTIDRLQQGTDVFAVVWTPIATVREVLVPARGRARVVEPVVADPVDDVLEERGGEPAVAPAPGWFGWLIPRR